MISLKAKYALRALFALARADPAAPLQISEIAEQERIPRKFLEQILLELKRRGLVASTRGAKGGYALLRPAKEITFTEVLRIIDGPIAPLPCLSVTAYRRCDDCPSEKSCLRRAFAEVAEAQRAVLSRTTIAGAIGAPRASRPGTRKRLTH